MRRSLAIGLGAATVLAPWLYVVTKFRGQLRIVQDNKLLFHPTNLDLASTRLALLPTIGPDKAGVTTPNLDAQISVPILGSLILLSILALAIRGGDQRTRRAFVFAAICAVTAWALFKLSVSEPAWQHLPKSFTIVQFPYRIVALVNVALLGALTGVLGALGRDRAHARASRLVLLGGLGLATAAMGFKVPRCLGPGGGGDAVVHDYVNPPGDWYYGAQDYATPAEFGALPGGPAKQSVKLPVASDHDFAAVGAAHVNVPARTAIRTNVQAFPWNLLTVDGQPVAHEATFVDGYWLATWVDAGEHQVGYEFRPPRAWSALHVMSLLLLTTWTCGWAFGPALARRLSRRREEARALEVGTS